VNKALFWRALAVQTLAVATLSGILVALPLSHDFFEDYGFVVGPLAWALCTLVTARVLSIPLAFALFAALAGGVAGGLVSLVTSHWVGVGVGLVVFAASCAGYDPRAAGEGAAAQ
jgi:hypothetical protein